jgi:CHAD domain-containing protein
VATAPGRDAVAPDTAAALAARIAADLANRHERLAVALERARRGGDPEAIHDLRVATRRLTAALRLWRELVPARERRRVRRGLTRIRRDAGTTRDLEVQVTWLVNYLRTQSPGSGSPVASWLERLDRRLARRRLGLARALGRGRVRRLSRALHRVEARVAAAPEPAPRALWHARARVAALRREATEAIRLGLAEPEDETLHRTRVALKKLRYALECLGRAGSDDPPLEIERLRAMQDALGEAHDRAVFTARIAKRVRREALRGEAATAAEFAPLVATLERERLESLEKFRSLAAAGG